MILLQKYIEHYISFKNKQYIWKESWLKNENTFDTFSLYE